MYVHHVIPEPPAGRDSSPGRSDISGRARRRPFTHAAGFHYHFKAITAVSPLQFQKQFRLQEDRRLMIGEGLDATRAGFRVSYSNASHFSREYKRLFGNPPIRDVEQLRGSAPGSPSL
jgi:methylphosphotriester-DNA--protein-cysteine methyltransferase